MIKFLFYRSLGRIYLRIIFGYGYRERKKNYVNEEVIVFICLVGLFLKIEEGLWEVVWNFIVESNE